jgi:hypothetical protein
MFLGPLDPSIIKQKYDMRKTLISTVFLLLFDFLSLKNDVNVPSKTNMQENFVKKFVFCWRLEGH